MPSSVLLLIGGGHAHLQVITAPLPTPATKRILISDSPSAVYSGMLPSVVAGLLPSDKAAINLPALCAANGTTFIRASVTRIDPHASKVFFRHHTSSIECTLYYNYLSINAGSTTKPIHPNFPLSEVNTSDLPFVVPTRPIANLNPSIQAFERQNVPGLPVVVIGAGAAGIELALALASRLSPSPVTLVSRAPDLASQIGRMPGHAVTAELHRRKVNIILGRLVVSISRETRTITLNDGEKLSFGLAVLATGAAPHRWLEDTGLQTDPSGWLLVDRTLKCIGFENVYAAGDCISFGRAFGPDFPPKAGVYAVRQGPILAHNLAISIRQTGKAKEFHPQVSFLSLLSTGDGGGVGSKYGIAFKGSWVYRLKNFIDEAWQERFRVSTEVRSSNTSKRRVDSIFKGSPVEGAAVLHPDAVRVDDSFDKQLMVLRRMDADEHFREAIVQIALEKNATCRGH